jgi:hypothetical protein
VRHNPWAWWIWHRLNFDSTPDGHVCIKADVVMATQSS